MAHLDPDTLKGQVGIFLGFYLGFTAGAGVEGLEMLTLFTASDSDGLSIRGMHRTLTDSLLVKTSYQNVRNTVALLSRKGLVTSDSEQHGRGQPKRISITPQGQRVVDYVLEQAQAIVDAVPAMSRPFIKAAALSVLETLTSGRTDWPP